MSLHRKLKGRSAWRSQPPGRQLVVQGHFGGDTEWEKELYETLTLHELPILIDVEAVTRAARLVEVGPTPLSLFLFCTFLVSTVPHLHLHLVHVASTYNIQSVQVPDVKVSAMASMSDNAMRHSGVTWTTNVDPAERPVTRSTRAFQCLKLPPQCLLVPDPGSVISR